MLFEKGFCRGAVGEIETLRYATGVAQRDAKGFRLGRQRVLRGDRLAAGAKRLVGGELVVIVPAGDLRPGERQILAAADLKRQFQLRIRKMAKLLGREREAEWRAWRAVAAVVEHTIASTQHAAAKRQRLRVSVSASGANQLPVWIARSCRGRMSRHR